MTRELFVIISLSIDENSEPEKTTGPSGCEALLPLFQL
jgi:hypothetical protein